MHQSAGSLSVTVEQYRLRNTAEQITPKLRGLIQSCTVLTDSVGQDLGGARLGSTHLGSLKWLQSDVGWGCIIQRPDWGCRVTSKVPHTGGWEAGWATGHRAQLLSTGLHEDPHARQAGWLHPEPKWEA